MVTENNEEQNELKNEDISDELTDEITAAVAELKAAQAKLDAAKAKIEEGKAASEAPQTAKEADETPIILDAVPVAVSSAASAAAQNVKQDPDWAPYTPGQSQSANGAASSPQSPSSYDANNAAGYQAAPQGSHTPPQPSDQPQQPYYTTSPYGSAPQDASANIPPQSSYQYQQTPPQQTYYHQTPPQQTYYQQGYTQPVTTKDHVAAGLLAIFLGSLGIHKFYLGYNTAGFIMLAVTILGSLITFGLAGAVVALIGFIEGIMYLIKSQSEFEYLYVFNKREWF